MSLKVSSIDLKSSSTIASSEKMPAAPAEPDFDDGDDVVDHVDELRVHLAGVRVDALVFRSAGARAW
jgi:hypothetical protein